MIFLFVIHQPDNNIRYIDVHIDHCNSVDIELDEILPDHIKKLPQEAIKIPKNNVWYLKLNKKMQLLNTTKGK